MKYNEEVAYDLGLSLEDIYVLEKIEDCIRDTNLSTDGNNGEFTFNQVNLFKMCKFVFKQVSKDDDQESIKKIYKTNNAKFNKMLKGALGKVLAKGENIKKQGKSEAYFKINKEIRTILINGYPSIIDRELTDIERLVMIELNISSLGKSIRKQLKDMDIEILKEAITISKEHGILDYPYIRSIYNNLVLEIKNPQESPNSQGLNENLKKSNFNTSIIPQNTKNKTRFHNFDERGINYTPDEFERRLLESQKSKFK